MKETPGSGELSGNFEEGRLAAVRQFLNINFKKRTDFQDIVDLVAELCDKPIALITLLDLELNWCKVSSVATAASMPRSSSFCRYAIQEDDVLVIPDATLDSRFDHNDLVQADPHLRFYAGAPLVLTNGLKVGTLCLFDLKPSSITPLQTKTLATLAKQVVFLMELELSHELLKKQVVEIENKNLSLKQIAYIQSHKIRQPLTSIMGLLNLVKSSYQEVDDEWLDMMSQATQTLDSRIREIVKEAMTDKDIKALRFSKMVEEIEDCAILLLDVHGHIENWNKGAEVLKGYSHQEIIGRNFSVFYTEEDIKNKVPQNHLTEAATVGFSKNERQHVRKNGSKFWGSTLITVIHDDFGKVIGFTKVTRDLSNMARFDATLVNA
jgi:PAS domain S-box-containing protein